MFKVIKERTYSFNHDDGTKSPVNRYIVFVPSSEHQTKEYAVEVGCKEGLNDGKVHNYVWSSNGRFCDPNKYTHKMVVHFLHNAITCNIVEEGEAA